MAVQITLNNGDVNDGYFHVNDDYEKVILLDGHGITRGSIDEPFGVDETNWQDTVSVITTMSPNLLPSRLSQMKGHGMDLSRLTESGWFYQTCMVIYRCSI